MNNNRTSTNTRQAVLWDLDGVIADTGLWHFISWQQAFKKLGRSFNEEDFRSIFGKRNDAIIATILGNNVPEEKIEEIVEYKENFFRQNVRKDLKIFPGVLNLLIVLRENGILSAIASSTPLENIHLILNELKIEDYFQAIACSHEVSEGKPSPLIFLKAAEKLNVSPGNCIVIEDAIAGVTAAKRGGMHCIAVTNSHPADLLADADLVVDSLERVGLEELKILFKGERIR
jgi:beta-phosphoglucomutase family hydrolase